MAINDGFVTDVSGICDEIADFFASSPSAQEIAEYRLSETSDRLIADLLEANRTRGLTPEERAALDEYASIERLVQAIKVRAYMKLKQTAE